MVNDADLIIRGRMVDLYVGEYWRGAMSGPLAYVKVEIAELLKGDPISRVPGFVEVQIGHAHDDLDTLRMKLPAHDHLWFLDYEDRERDPGNQSDIAGFVYYAAQELEKVFRNIDGVVEVLRPDRIRDVYGADDFILTLDGTPFEDFVQRVRDELAAARLGILARRARDVGVQIDRPAAC